MMVIHVGVACMMPMSAAGMVFLATANGLADWFVGGGSRQPELAALTARLVRIAAFAQPPLALRMVFSGGVRGACGMRLPLAIFHASDSIELPARPGTIPGPGLSVVGAWYAMAADLTVRGLAMPILFSRKFSRKNWSRVRV